MLRAAARAASERLAERQPIATQTAPPAERVLQQIYLNQQPQQTSWHPQADCDHIVQQRHREREPRQGPTHAAKQVFNFVFKMIDFVFKMMNFGTRR